MTKIRDQEQLIHAAEKVLGGKGVESARPGATPTAGGGLAVALGLSPNNSVRSAGAPSPSNGQRSYCTGADATGPIPRTIAGRGMTGFGMMGNIACVDCHGEDGRGGRVGMMFGTIDIPDIRYLTLTTARSDNGTSIPAWTDSDITHAIRDGVEPNGQALKAPMPRWSISDDDVADVITYLKELDKR